MPVGKRIVSGKDRRTMQKPPIRQQSGNVLFYILIAIGLIGALTFAMSRMQQADPSTADKISMDEQIQRLFIYSAAVGGTINQMIAGGMSAQNFYTQLDTTLPGAAGFETAPHNRKIYHPYGGGLTPQFESAASTDSNRVAYQYNIHKGAFISDIGKTSAVVSDVVFVARISTLAQCQRINKMLYNSTTVPAMTNAAFNALFVAAGAATPSLAINSIACAGCVGKVQQCISNSDASGYLYGYYSALLPG